MSAVAQSVKGHQLVFIVQKLGPYHHARLRAFSKASGHEVAVVETRPDDQVYKWGGVEQGAYRRHQVSSEHSLTDLLGKIDPAVIVCTGYSDPEIHWAMTWAFERERPLITCSDSSELDRKRNGFKELLKRILVAGFDAGLIAGTRSREYLASLGMPSDRLFQPWDVVDNEHFAGSAPSVQQRSAELRCALGLTGECFLFVGRFIWEKNLEHLLSGYAMYVKEAVGQPWPLLLVGSGIFEPILRRRVCEARLESLVKFCGHVDCADLPLYYHACSALVLPSLSETWGLVVNEAMAASLPVLVSKRCGCAPDLVQNGVNGYLFDPEDAKELCALMVRLHGTDPGHRREMGQRSQEIIARYSPTAFASGLKAAVECALENRGRRIPLSTRLAVRALASRRS